ncbi:MAG TPA: GntR family transcriptional regulator, partial [Candidatus Acidoferrales bacterium]|nr:GntR family transcriptional regulator [Candidatus Acidoferrales bacterium]
MAASFHTASEAPETWRLDRRSPLPLHAQAERLLRQLINRREYRNGGFLPEEVSLSRTLGVSRNTLRAAILRLVAEGRLERKAGVGTRVTEPKIKSGVGAWHSFTREMQAKGIRVETFSIKVRSVPASAELARALQVPLGTRLLLVDRVRGWAGQPEVHFRSYLHPRLGLNKDDDFHEPLYDLIQQRRGIVADQSWEEFTAVAAARPLATLL